MCNPYTFQTKLICQIYASLLEKENKTQSLLENHLLEKVEQNGGPFGRGQSPVENKPPMFLNQLGDKSR